MVRKKTLGMRITAFAAAMIFFMTLLLLFPAKTFRVAADEYTRVEDAGMKITASITLNGEEIAANSQVKNGDQIKLEVDWTLPNDFEYINGKFVYDLSDKLHGITLDNKVIPVGNTAVYRVEGDKLYIELLTGHSSRYGSCNLSGTINVSSEDVDENSKFNIEFIGTPSANDNSHITSVPVIVTDYIPGLFIDKNTVGELTYENGTYYQSFEIKVRSNGNTSTAVNITDVGSNIYDFANIKDFTVNNVAATPTKTSDGFTYSLGDVAADGNDVVINYTVPVKIHELANGTVNGNANTVTGTSGNNSVSDTAYAAIYAPNAYKSGTYDADTKKITWTITVEPNALLKENISFTVTDIPGSGLTAEQISAAFEGKTELTEADFTYDTNTGKYTKTFTTTVTDEQAATATNLYIKNNIQTKFDGIDKVFATEGTVTIPGNVKFDVSKTAGEKNPDGTVPWTITIEVPNRDDVTDIVVHDYTSPSAITTMSASQFKVNGTHTLAAQGAQQSGTDVGYFDWAANNCQFHINNADFISANKGKTITVSYNMTIPADTKSVTNTAEVYMSVGGANTNTVKAFDTFNGAEYKVEKYISQSKDTFNNVYYEQIKDLKYTTLWGIKITERVPEVGDVITITDTIPDGMVLVPDCYLVSGVADNGWGYVDNSSCLNVTTAGNVVTFTLTVTQELIDDINMYAPNLHPLSILYMTRLADDKAADYYHSSETREFTNTAAINIAGEDLGTVTETASFTPPVSDIVTKTAAEVTNADPNDYSVYSDYTIIINNAKADLVDGDEITVTDQLGSELEFVGDITIWSATYGTQTVTPTGNALNLTLKDETTYTVTYRVKVNTIGSDVQKTDAEIEAMFGNKVSVSTETNNNFSCNALAASYRSEGSYGYDEVSEKITISGTKSWVDDNEEDKNARPNEIIIKLKLTKTASDDTVTYDEKTVTVPVNELQGNENAWSYTIENLATKLADGTTIKYDVIEVTAEGYAVTYPNNNNIGITAANNSTYNLDIKNTFTADTIEVGTLKITKAWSGGTDADRPADLSFTVTDDYNNTYTQTLGNDGTATFTNLPLYTYSRDTDGNLVRTVRKYKLTETSTDTEKLAKYDMSVSSLDGNGYFTLTDNTNTKGTALATPAEITVTNTYNVTPVETTSVSVTKVWDDNNDQYGNRPDNITVKLLAGGAESKTAELNAGNSWNYTFADLPKKDNDENAIAYTIEEVAVNGYTSEITGNAENGFTVTNTTKFTSVSGTKTWVDNENADGKRPASITVNLLDNGALVESATVTSANGWSYTFANLPTYRNGTAAVYTVDEEAVDGYTKTINGYNITNTHTPETVTISGTKTWEDDNNRDGKRPESITVRLLAGGNEVASKIVTAADGWTYTFADMPKYSGGNEIVYTISEDTVTDYSTVINGYDITNTHSSEKISISGSKSWNDNSNHDGLRPSSITVNLYKNGSYLTSTTATEAGGWSYSFSDLYKYEDGKEITYTIAEETVKYYKPSYSGYDITNEYTYPLISIQVKKVWEDNNNQDNKRPSSVTVTLSPTGTTATLSEANNWTCTFDNIPLNDDNGTPIAYSVSEASVSNYTSSVSGDAERGFVITNTYNAPQETTSVSGTKTWNDNNNQDGIRPDSITVNLYGNGNFVASTTATAATSWAYEFTNLPKNNAGNPITYTVTETPVFGYSTEINGYDITNTHTPETVTVNGAKTWIDNDDSTRPASITVRLLADGNEAASKTVTAADGWAYEFANLPKNNAGVPIVYTITEDAVANYDATVIGYNITNTYNAVTPAETVSVSVTKNWDDNSNSANARPSTLKITLYQDGSVYTTMSADWVKNGNTWTYTFTGLPKYDANTSALHVYTIAEESLSARNYSLVSSTNSGYSFTLVNKYTPASDNPNTPIKPIKPNQNNQTNPNITVIPDNSGSDSPDSDTSDSDTPDSDTSDTDSYIPGEDVSSDSGISLDDDLLGNTDTTAYAFTTIILAFAIGGVMVIRRRQRK